MNTEKVFTAFNKAGGEILLYRKDNDTYIDLQSENNVIYPKEDIELDTLMFASKSLNLRKHMLESSIKRKYKKDREQLIEVKKVLLGLKVIITNLEKVREDSGFRLYNIPLYNTHYHWNYEEKRLGLYMFSKSEIFNKNNFNIYKDLFEHQEYLGINKSAKHISEYPMFGLNFEYIIFKDVSVEELKKESFMEKKRVYEFANEIRKTLIKKGN